MRKPIRIGIGGPVGSWKSGLLLLPFREMGKRYSMGVFNYDFFT